VDRAKLEGDRSSYDQASHMGLLTAGGPGFTDVTYLGAAG